MRWTSEWGPQIKKLVEIEQATGQTPQAFLDAPVCFGFERDLVLAYNHLAARRQLGLSVNPITLSEIESFVRLFGTPQMPMDIFVELLGEMDNEYLQKLNSHGNRSPRPNSAPSNRQHVRRG